MPTLDDIRARFAADRFATALLGAEIVLAEPRHAVCTFPVSPDHLNAAGSVMGGAIFTLADFAFAVAANGCAEEITVSQSADIHFLSAAKGPLLQAEASCIKAGRTTSLYRVDVTDSSGKLVAFVSIAGYTIR